MSSSESDEPTFKDPSFTWKPSGRDNFSDCLFLTSKGSSINFYVYDDAVSKQRIESLISEYGGSIANSIIEPFTIILVQESFKPPESWGPVYSRLYIRDCITAFRLLNLDIYLNKGCVAPDRVNVMLGLFEEDFTFRPTPKKNWMISEKALVKLGSSNNIPPYPSTQSNSSAIEKCPVASSSNHQISCVKSKKHTCKESNNIANVNSKKIFVVPNTHKRRRTDNSTEDHSTVAGCSHVDAKSNPDCKKLVKHKKTLPFNPQSYNEMESDSDKSEVEACAQGSVRQCTVDSTTQRAHRRPVSSDSDDSIPDFKNFGRLKKFNKVDKHSRRKFSREEKEKILKYIVAKKAYCRLKSDALYREMEDRELCPIRTYQSLKNHFLKTILHELDLYAFLTEEQKRKLRGEINY